MKLGLNWLAIVIMTIADANNFNTIQHMEFDWRAENCLAPVRPAPNQR